MVVVRVVVFLAGAAAVLATLLSALRTFVVPRGTPVVVLTRAVFVASRWLYARRARRARTYEARDRVMAGYAPVTLVVLPVVWLAIVGAGGVGMFWALGVASLREAFRLSGSSLFTLGFADPPDLPTTVLAFSEAIVGLGLLALLLAYLPTIYTAFSRREAQVALVEVRAGSPPTPEELLRRAHALGWLDRLSEWWEDWQGWFIDIEETHTSFASLPHFRSPEPHRSWVTAAGCVLDAAAVRSAAIDLPRDPAAELCIRSGYVALRRIASYFGIPFDPAPAPGDPVTVSRQEFDELLDRLEQGGLPVKADRERAWRDWAGWRVNYDAVLLGLAGLTMAPFAPWSSDRSASYRRPPLRRPRRRR